MDRSNVHFFQKLSEVRFTFLHWHFACINARWRHFYGLNLAEYFRCS